MLEENSNSQNVNYTITSCQRGTSQGSYKIILGDGSSFFISVDFFLFHKLKKGLKLEPDLYHELERESQFTEAYLKAISLLRRQQYTTYNLKVKLLSKEYNKVAVEKVLEKLQEKQYLDDEKYAQSWIESRLKSKLDSYTSLYSGLLNKGISSVIARSSISKYYTEEIECDIIKKSIDKCCRVGKPSDKIIKALIRKGFNRNKVFYFVNDIGRINEGY